MPVSRTSRLQSLRVRVPLVVFAVFVVVLSVFAGELQRELLRSYQDIDRADMVTDVERARTAFFATGDRLVATAADWAIWTDTYRFMSGQDPGYKDKNLVPETIQNLSLDFMVLSTLQGRIVWSGTIDPATGEYIEGSGELEAAIHENLPALLPKSSSEATGLAVLNDRAAAFACFEITDNERKSKANGLLIIGNYVDDDDAARVKALTGLDVAFFAPAAQSGRPIRVDDSAAKTIQGSLVLDGVGGTPATTLSVTKPKMSQERADNTMSTVGAGLVASIVTFALALAVALETTILRRLARLHAYVMHKKPFSDTSLSRVGGRDEIAGLAAALDNALLRAASSEELLKHQVDHDYLTGLANRRYLEREATRTLAEADRTGGTVALLVMDLNNFKQLNDTAGHHGGDDALVCFAERAGSVVRGYSTLARTGGDEFAVLLPGSDRPAAALVAERLHEALAEHPCECAGNTFELSASIGIAVFPDDGQTLEDLTRVADAGMYEAKRIRAGTQ